MIVEWIIYFQSARNKFYIFTISRVSISILFFHFPIFCITYYIFPLPSGAQLPPARRVPGPRTTSNSAVQDDGDCYKKWTTKQRRIGRYSLYDLLWWENTRAGACVLSSETSARVHRNTWLYPGCVMDHKVQCLSRQASFALLIHVFNRRGIILVFLDDEAVSELDTHSSCTHHPHI